MGPSLNALAAASRALAVAGVLLLAGCTQQRDTVAESCFAEPAAMAAMLRQDPPVVLGDGTRLAGCVSAARTDGELQSLGLLFVRVADMLRAEAASDPDAAFALGYLSGAVRRGSRASSGSIAAQLARRVDQVATLDPSAGATADAALARGRQAGARNG